MRAFLEVGQSIDHVVCRKCGEQIAPSEQINTPAAYKPMPIPEPLTEAQIRDRREILRQQTEFLKAKYADKGKTPAA